jgi:two-component system, OmpR family, phosphate regulon response regulator PhoB
MAKQIILVEDDLDIQRVYGEKLKTEGYDVHLAVDAPHALNLLEQIDADLILLDIMLPGDMNGFEMLERIKKDERFKQIPVIVLTNLDTEKEQAMSVGAADYLIKAETDLSVLMEKIKHLT